MENEDIPEFNYIDVYIDEKDLINSLFISKEDNKINHNLIYNLTFTPIGYDEYANYSGFYIASNILREELGFNNLTKPGDFDILLIPFSDNKVHFERTCAIEVKVVRPTRSKPKKNANSMGEEQVYGLINDGFPLVGLIHICMAEPLKENEKQRIKFIKGGIGEGASQIPLDERDTEDIFIDYFSGASSVNQMKRLISKGFPKYVGLFTFGLNIGEDNTKRLSFDQEFNVKYEAGYFNPKKSEQTIERIEKYWTYNKEKFVIANM